MGCSNSKSQNQKKKQDINFEVEKVNEQFEQRQLNLNKKQSSNNSEQNHEQATNNSPPEEGRIQNLKDSFEKGENYKKEKNYNSPRITCKESNFKQLNKRRNSVDSQDSIDIEKNNFQNTNNNSNSNNNSNGKSNNNNTGNGTIPSYMFKQSREEANRLKMNSTQYTGYLKFLTNEKMEPSEQSAKEFIQKYQTKYGHTYQTHHMNNSREKNSKEEQEQIKNRKEKFMKRYAKLKNEEKMYDFNEILDNQDLNPKDIQQILDKYTIQDEKKSAELITDRIALNGLKQIIIFKNMQNNMDENQLAEINRLKEQYYQKKNNFKIKLKDVLEIEGENIQTFKQQVQLKQNDRKIRNKNKTQVISGVAQFKHQFVKQQYNKQMQNQQHQNQNIYQHQNQLHNFQQNKHQNGMNNSNPTKTNEQHEKQNKQILEIKLNSLQRGR
ncbi:hypothetical protein PPERSA_04617 [Pseudocohnilembus persalinus]|uniref:Uncharacterized protein n=1 Tax=Pseudocohnilembus persalinus TaxID=266149 RepID=A0A0V0QNI3_PSEPJ|nr:hypothetical protein PPERSA_04617 [Pseudocohnilembus persalinus]|eukprot:KRX03822.1 hypothetical protein PPERSA_04617 [Pseudocohnilembus persalinus]